MKLTIYITIISLFLFAKGQAQETGYGPAYQTLLMSNPALSGAEGTGTLRLSYLNFFPGNGYNFHSFYASYDSYFSSLQGGIGVWLAKDLLGGIIDDVRGGASYSYSLRAGKDLYVNAGLSAGLFNRGLDFSSAVLPDMISPIGGITFPTAETLIHESRTVFDPGAGFVIFYKNTIAGFAINHLSQPDLYKDKFSDKLKRKAVIHAASRIIVSEKSMTAITPGIYFELQGSQFIAGLGSAFEVRNFALNALLIADADNLNMQTGFSIDAGKLNIFYNYRLNISSENILMPFSLLHQTGLAFSLNNVEKRNILKTITLPKM
ncbi:MAG TPA: PorP/SprF family type IX secretion system membrane protein [Bacteroidales bacterium]|nr:PorP/SprF family type IX secretion system membrane protein [Bacteroidales bacterium]